MFCFPKGRPLSQGLTAATHPLPELLANLARGRLSGYASFTLPASQALLVMNDGRLIGAGLSRGGVRLTGLEALVELCERVVTEEATLDVFRLSPDLAVCLQALLQGETLGEPQALATTNVQELLAKVKADRLTGCLRITAAERTALILYKDGASLGFFHDGAETLESSPGAAQNVAKLPGARVTVFCTRRAELTPTYDLLEILNVDKLWQGAVQRHGPALARLRADAAEAEAAARRARLGALEAALQQAAQQHVGKLGRALVDRTLTERGGLERVASLQEAAAFVAAVERGAGLLVGASAVRALGADLRANFQRQLGLDLTGPAKE